MSMKTSRLNTQHQGYPSQLFEHTTALGKKPLITSWAYCYISGLRPYTLITLLLSFYTKILLIHHCRVEITDSGNFPSSYHFVECWCSLVIVPPRLQSHDPLRHLAWPISFELFPPHSISCRMGAASSCHFVKLCQQICLPLCFAIFVFKILS